MKEAFLVGCDPELFLKDGKGNFVSAHTILPGTKLEPYAVDSGAIQVDGVAAEFNIAPASTSKAFVNHIATVMKSLDLYKDAKNSSLRYVIEPYAIFNEAYFQSLPENVRELGCNPDFNAWTGQVNPSPEGDGTTMRTASGHLHVGWTKDTNPFGKIHFEDCRMFIRECDYFLGLNSLRWDQDNTRRKLYGNAGAFRPKPYGAEYRVLSNVWLKSPKLQAWIFETIQAVKNRLMGSKPQLQEMFGDYAQKVINENQVDWWNTKEGQKVFYEMGVIEPPPLTSVKPKTDEELFILYNEMKRVALAQ